MQKLKGGEERGNQVTALAKAIEDNLQGTGKFDRDSFAKILSSQKISDKTIYDLATDQKLLEKFARAAADCEYQSGRESPTARMLIAVSGSSAFQEQYKPLMAIWGLTKLSSELQAMHKRGFSVQDIEKAVVEKTPEIVNSMMFEIKPDMSGLPKMHAAVYGGAYKPAFVPSKETEREELTEQVISSIAAAMDERARENFLGLFAEVYFKPALEKLPMSVLGEFAITDKGNLLDLANYYHRLHANFLERGGFGGPAMVIREVAGDGRVPENMKFKCICVVLRNLYETATDPMLMGGALKRANDSLYVEGLLDDYAADPKKFDAEWRNLELSLKLRAAVAPSIKDEKMREKFLDDPSIYFFMRSLHKLDNKVVNELLQKEPMGFAETYAKFHGSMLDREWFGVPAEAVSQVADRLKEEDVQAAAITAILKRLSEEKLPPMPLMGRIPERKYEAEKLAVGIETMIAAEGQEKVKQELRKEVLG